jgi:DNA polymerase III epsilon subunit-like protein
VKNLSLAFILALMSFSATSQAQTQWFIEGNSLVCSSEEAFDEQMMTLAQGVKQFVSGCRGTPKAYQVVMLELNTFSASKARIVETGAVVFVDQGSIQTR